MFHFLDELCEYIGLGQDAFRMGLVINSDVWLCQACAVCVRGSIKIGSKTRKRERERGKFWLCWRCSIMQKCTCLDIEVKDVEDGRRLNERKKGDEEEDECMLQWSTGKWDENLHTSSHFRHFLSCKWIGTGHRKSEEKRLIPDRSLFKIQTTGWFVPFYFLSGFAIFNCEIPFLY